MDFIVRSNSSTMSMTQCRESLLEMMTVYTNQFQHSYLLLMLVDGAAKK